MTGGKVTETNNINTRFVRYANEKNTYKCTLKSCNNMSSTILDVSALHGILTPKRVQITNNTT